MFHSVEGCHIISGGGTALVIIVFSGNFVYCTSKITNIEVDLIRALLLFVGVIGVLVGLLSLSKTLRGTIGGKNNVGKEPRMLEVLPTQFTLAVENIDPT